MKKILNFLYRKATKVLYEQIDALCLQLEEAKEQLEELKKPDIEMNLVDDSDIPSTPKSIRINVFVWEDWQEFCEENEEYSKKQLVSMALKEFMERHN